MQNKIGQILKYKIFEVFVFYYICMYLNDGEILLTSEYIHIPETKEILQWRNK